MYSTGCSTGILYVYTSTRNHQLGHAPSIRYMYPQQGIHISCILHGHEVLTGNLQITRRVSFCVWGFNLENYWIIKHSTLSRALRTIYFASLSVKLAKLPKIEKIYMYARDSYELYVPSQVNPKILFSKYSPSGRRGRRSFRVNYSR